MNDTDNQQERLRDMAWLAGLWEGEGHFGFTTHGKVAMYPRAQIYNTDYDLIEEIHAVLKRYGIGHYINEHKRMHLAPEHKNLKTIYVVGMKRVQTLINFLLPEIRGKKKRIAELLLEYVERRLALPQGTPLSSIDLAYKEQVKVLNKKGPPESSEAIRQTVSTEDMVQAV